jgi:protein transport protein SEC20
MAPIPEVLSQEATNIIDNLERRQADLETFQIPRLRDTKTSLAIQQQHAAELREDLEYFDKQIEVNDLIPRRL